MGNVYVYLFQENDIFPSLSIFNDFIIFRMLDDLEPYQQEHEDNIALRGNDYQAGLQERDRIVNLYYNR